jgi:hypothetical protein
MSLWVVSVFGLFQVLATVFLCYPIPYFWDRTIPGGRCFNEPILYTTGTLTIITDFWVVFLAVFILRNSMMPLAQKIGVFSLLALGGL